MDADLTWAAIADEALNIDATLASGQAFRWRRTASGAWVGAIGGCAVRVVPATGGFWWQTLPEPGRWDVLAAYFALDVDLAAARREWTARAPECAQAFARWRGLRVLRQKPTEALFAFSCACCNTVTKVSRSVHALARRCGDLIAAPGGVPVFRFPDASRIAALDERDLRSDLWGFRAPRLLALASEVAARPPCWLDGLRDVGYADARRHLEALPGIGRKIADCVCLFGLGYDEAVPVDTHVRQIALRRLGSGDAQGSLTPRRYDAVAGSMRAWLGPLAGWAQQALFMEELVLQPGRRAGRPGASKPE